MATDDSAWSDTDWSDNFDLPEDTEPTDPDEEEPVDDNYLNSFSDDFTLIYEEVLPPENAAYLLNPMTGGADAEADALREEILNSETPEYNITGTTYYVSPSGDDWNDGLTPETAWRTPDAISINDYLFEEGDAVLFERGGIYRRNTAITVRDGMTYGAYGEGDKPVIYGSASNYSWGTRWEPSNKENVWKIQLTTGEAGIIVFNHGEEASYPYYHGLNELSENGDFYFNSEYSMLYLYLDKGYPNVVYEDIEIGTRERIFDVPEGTTDVLIDNIAMKYAGLFAVDVNEFIQNVSITNCEIGWIGGVRTGGANNTSTSVGLGNAIQFWATTDDALVENCWVYQVYDAGLSPQGIFGAVTYKNIAFRRNLIEYCNYSIEVFDRDSGTKWDGLYIEDNIMRFAGYGYLPQEERPDRSWTVSHYNGWTWNYDELPGDGIVIKNNIFDCSTTNLVYWSGKDYTSGLTISGNSFYQKKNNDNRAITFGTAGVQYATNQAELEAAVKVFDPNPKVVKWLD